jgi:elongation factor P--beta-lysine ligase
MVEVDFVCRVLSIQKHKNSHFLYVSGLDDYRQMIIDPDMSNQNGIALFSIITGKYALIKNSKNKLIPHIIRLQSCVVPALQPIEAKNHIDRVSNTTLSLRLFYHQFLAELSKHFLEQGYYRLSSIFTMNERGTSTVNPVKATGEHIDKFIKITHEIELKKEMAFLLKPFFEIGFVARDVFEGKVSSSEYLILEFVNPTEDERIVVEEIVFIKNLAMNLASQIGVKHLDLSDMTVVDLADEVRAQNPKQLDNWFESKKKNTKNTLYLNAPTSSPLVRNVGGFRHESIWILNGNSIAHGYQDENDYMAIFNAFNAQKRELASRGVSAEMPEDFLSIVKMGLPLSVSFGFGLDRFLTRFLLFSSISELHRFGKKANV